MKHSSPWAILAFVTIGLTVASCVTPSQVSYFKDMEYGVDYNAKPAPELVLQSVPVVCKFSVRIQADELACYLRWIVLGVIVSSASIMRAFLLVNKTIDQQSLRKFSNHRFLQSKHVSSFIYKLLYYSF